MHSYGKITQPYKKEIQDIYKDYLIVEEKIDGSQFRIQINPDNTIECGSHHQELSLEDSPFKLGTDNAQKIFKSCWPENTITVYCEYLSKPKQVTIPYERVPKHNLIIFDVQVGDRFLNRKEKEEFAYRWDMEVVPLLWEGNGEDLTQEVINDLLKTPSVLGHQPGFDRVEGIVIKDYKKCNATDGHYWNTKIVNEAHRELSKSPIPKGSKIEELKESFRTETRWNKGIQHLEENGELEHDMRDMQKLAPRVVKDIEEECETLIKDQLYKMFKKEIMSHAVKGLPEYYKEKLIQNE